MIKNGREVYLFNPYRMSEWTNEDIKNQFDILIDSYDSEAGTMGGYANNIENLANQLYLISETIARISKDVTLLKSEIETEYNKQVYIERSSWESKHKGKAPAMTYFQALANSDKSIMAMRQKLAEYDSRLKRFKGAYDSLEEKLNAQKKQMEALKYELSARDL